MNKTLEESNRKILKDLLSQCTKPQQGMFKRMYSHENLELPIDKVVDNMDSSKLDLATTQVENTLRNK